MYWHAIISPSVLTSFWNFSRWENSFQASKCHFYFPPPIMAHFLSLFSVEAPSPEQFQQRAHETGWGALQFYSHPLILDGFAMVLHEEQYELTFTEYFQWAAHVLGTSHRALISSSFLPCVMRNFIIFILPRGKLRSVSRYWSQDSSPGYCPSEPLLVTLYSYYGEVLKLVSAQ